MEIMVHLEERNSWYVYDVIGSDTNAIRYQELFFCMESIVNKKEEIVKKLFIDSYDHVSNKMHDLY